MLHGRRPRAAVDQRAAARRAAPTPPARRVLPHVEDHHAGGLCTHEERFGEQSQTRVEGGLQRTTHLLVEVVQAPRPGRSALSCQGITK
eukprot:scaffold68265_cov60-Phaeocystis_antarctica.AAC.3